MSVHNITNCYKAKPGLPDIATGYNGGLNQRIIKPGIKLCRENTLSSS